MVHLVKETGLPKCMRQESGSNEVMLMPVIKALVEVIIQIDVTHASIALSGTIFVEH